MTISKHAKAWTRCNAREKIERWQNVLRVLEGLTPQQRKHEFDMNTWGHKRGCKTAACAAGHCAMDQWFNKRGFVMTWDTFEYFNKVSKVQFGRLSVDPSKFFGSEGTSEIFWNTDRRPVEDVIQEVRNYIAVLTFELTRGKHGKAKGRD